MARWPWTGNKTVDPSVRRIARSELGKSAARATKWPPAHRAPHPMSCRSIRRSVEYSSCPRARGGHVVDIGDRRRGVRSQGVATCSPMDLGLAPGSARERTIAGNSMARHAAPPASSMNAAAPAQVPPGVQGVSSPPADWMNGAEMFTWVARRQPVAGRSWGRACAPRLGRRQINHRCRDQSQNLTHQEAPRRADAERWRSSDPCRAEMSGQAPNIAATVV